MKPDDKLLFLLGLCHFYVNVTKMSQILVAMTIKLFQSILFHVDSVARVLNDSIHYCFIVLCPKLQL